MGSWITSIFSESSDQARLFTVVFTAIIGLIIVFINQSLVSKRESRVYIKAKVEDLFTTAVTLYDKSKHYYLVIDKIKSQGVTTLDYQDMKHIHENSREMLMLILKLELLITLYFPKMQKIIIYPQRNYADKPTIGQPIVTIADGIELIKKSLDNPLSNSKNFNEVDVKLCNIITREIKDKVIINCSALPVSTKSN
jgi:hypothetical protein